MKTNINISNGVSMMIIWSQGVWEPALWGNILESWLFVLASNWGLGDMSRYDALSGPRYWQYVRYGDSFLTLDLAPFPISSVRYCWQLWPWEMKNDKGNTKFVLVMVKYSKFYHELAFIITLKGIFSYADIKGFKEQHGLNRQLKWELKLLFVNARADCWDGPLAWCDIGRKGGTQAGLFIAGWAWP